MKTTPKRITDTCLPHVVLGLLLVIGLFMGLRAFARWEVNHSIDWREKAIRTGQVKDESTVVLSTLVDSQGVHWVYYKLGHSDYAQFMRAAGIGCRFYAGGSAYSFEKLKTTDPIRFDAFPAGSTIVGECDPTVLTDHFDLARAQQ
ncbi:hypothetical protein G3O01_10125 [Burkholderia sp. Ac-20365]|nr:hypothetical protein [Burkholderia sp. Ac-20365]